MKNGWKTSEVSQRAGFTLIELLVVISIIMILAGMLLPSLARAKQQANRIKCLNNMRQLGLSLIMYADENEGQFPPRRTPPSTWINRLEPYYRAEDILHCPSDGFIERRSYLINGFNDYFETILTPAEYVIYKNWNWSYGMRETAIPVPSETIAFGEKVSGSPHVHMDFYQGNGNDIEEVEQSRHKSKSQQRSGSSNYTFVDGSVRLLRFGRSVNPLNLWAVTDLWRGVPINVP